MVYEMRGENNHPNRVDVGRCAQVRMRVCAGRGGVYLSPCVYEIHSVSRVCERLCGWRVIDMSVVEGGARACVLQR